MPRAEACYPLGMASAADRYWARFRKAHPGAPERYVESFFFGTKPEHAAEITELVLSGTKTATGSPLWSYEADEKPVPAVGDHWVVTNGGDDPACIIETTEVHTIPFGAVGMEWALWGGEEDRTLASWRRMYWRYLVSECRRIGREPSDDAPLVMERFRLVYSEPRG
jgi:uncharacterized protein YhfF